MGNYLILGVYADILAGHLQQIHHEKQELINKFDTTDLVEELARNEVINEIFKGYL